MKRVVVIGLGIFGFNIAKDLYENGIEVIAIDKNKDVIQKIKDFSTKAILADGTDKGILESIGIQEDDVVAILKEANCLARSRTVDVRPVQFLYPFQVGPDNVATTPSLIHKIDPFCATA
jgi:3-hydroxyacyl-CoA dehydrogenase